jgi:glycosyltransferase involved in cell wall biosynthesis
VRIAVVSTFDLLDWGGSEELWAAMATVARAAGHDVLASVNEWREQPRRIAALEADGVEVRTRNRVRQRALYRASPPLPIPIRLGGLDRFGPDVVCLSHGATWDVARDAGLHAAIKRHVVGRGIPYVPLIQYGTGYEWLYDDQRARASEYFGAAAAVGWVADENRVAAERLIAAPIERSFLVQNPITVSAEVVPWPEATTAELACVARLDAGAKGQDVLIEALAGDEWPDRDWRLTFYGAGPDHAWLTDLIRHYGLTDRIVLAGHVDRVDELWRRHHALVLPSRAEGTSLALLEAMAVGRPCVATDVGGALDWVVPGQTGFLASAPTASSIRRALEAFWSARSTWQSMGVQAHEVFVRRRDPDPGATLLGHLERAASTRSS